MQGFFVLIHIRMNINKLQLSHIKQISPMLASKLSVVVLSILIFETLLYPLPIFADFIPTSDIINTTQNTLPQNSDREYTVKYSKYTTITAYNSEPGQTDDSPCITANGFNVCKRGIEDTIAANFLRFGTKVRIPEVFGNRIFTVRDRMNKRYTNRVDIWMLEKNDAILLGKRLAKIEVLE